MRRTALRILVADDVHDSADALSMLLQLEGYAVSVARGGLEAIHLSESFSPHIAVLDIGMPDVDGYEAARRIHQSHWGSAIHLIAFTGWNDGESRSRATAAGFHQYVVKPIDPGRFVRMISDLDIEG